MSFLEEVSTNSTQLLEDTCVICSPACRYAFAELGSSEQVEKALEGFDVSKLGKGVRIANYDQLRDGTLNPWPANLRPKVKKGKHM